MVTPKMWEGAGCCTLFRFNNVAADGAFVEFSSIRGLAGGFSVGSADLSPHQRNVVH